MVPLSNVVPLSNQAGGWLLNVEMSLFAGDQPIEDRQNLFAILINAIEIGAKRPLKIPRVRPLVNDHARNINILTQRIEGMPAEEKAIKKCGLPLWGQRIEIVYWSHLIPNFRTLVL